MWKWKFVRRIIRDTPIFPSTTMSGSGQSSRLVLYDRKLDHFSPTTPSLSMNIFHDVVAASDELSAWHVYVCTDRRGGEWKKQKKFSIIVSPYPFMVLESPLRVLWKLVWCSNSISIHSAEILRWHMTTPCVCGTLDIMGFVTQCE